MREKGLCHKQDQIYKRDPSKNALCQLLSFQPPHIPLAMSNPPSVSKNAAAFVKAKFSQVIAAQPPAEATLVELEAWGKMVMSCLVSLMYDWVHFLIII